MQTVADFQDTRVLGVRSLSSSLLAPANDYPAVRPSGPACAPAA